jgi:protein kinase A
MPMGFNSTSEDVTRFNFPVLKRSDFDFIKPIGKGGFGKVWLV